MSATTQSQGGVGCLTVLGIIFVVLKLVHTIDWSWWLVLLPFYGPIALAIVIFLLVLIFGGYKERR